ncbi:sensor histidine kinase [Nocardioides dongkuii]|uniref:sensor histidine kinase n=1 Tax=Nocardioides dongkuii TaxID=2760089 RepID=UPI001878D5E9|nr:PAS domain-containing sensor histidine kinase [Nocardioides dongkuii]
MTRLLDPGPTGRAPWFVLWQLPVVALTLLLALALALAEPALLGTPSMLLGLALIALASVVAFQAPARGLIAVPLADILAIGLIRSETYTELPAVSAIAMVPILCLGSNFGRAGILSAVVGAVFVNGYSYFRHTDLPDDGIAWIGAASLPVAAVAVAVIAYAGARALRAQQGEIVSKSAELGASLLEAEFRRDMTRTILESLDVAVAFFSTEGRLVAANHRAIDLATKGGVDVRGAVHAATLFWRADRIATVPVAQQPLPAALGGVDLAPELFWIGEPGDQVAAMMSARQVYGADGDRIGVVVVADDVTELVESVRVRDQFLATLSHELRNPLVSVVGYLDVLTQEIPGRVSDSEDEMVAMLRTARTSARTLTERIDHLLVASAQDRLTLDLDRIDLTALVASVADRYTSLAGARGVTLVRELEPVSTTADAHKIGLLVDNLISNAVKHTAAGGEVTLRLGVRSLIELVVSDTGTGLERHERQRAFDRFYRTEAARRDVVQGLGLGLSICKAVVEAHGGEISLKSSPSRGTTVTVLLPRRAG